MKTIDIPSGYKFKRYNPETNQIELEEELSSSSKMEIYNRLLQFKNDYFLYNLGKECHYYIAYTPTGFRIIHSSKMRLNDFAFVDKDYAMQFFSIYKDDLEKIKELL